MTDNQRVFIRGVAGRGIDVIAALEKLGGKTGRIGSMRLSALGNIPLNVFIIGHDGEIAYMDSEGEVFEIIKDNYREIKLPEKWKYGDVLIKKDGSSFDIFYRYVQDFSFSPLLEVTETVCNEYQRIVTVYTGFYRLATPSEVERFHELLHKHGKDWDAEKKQLVDWKWKPKRNERYWFVSSSGRIKDYGWTDSPADEAGFDFGNCFRTREEAEAMAEKVRKLLKGETN